MTRPGDFAFPETDNPGADPGLTVREFFAIKIMAGFAAAGGCSPFRDHRDDSEVASMASQATRFADALIKALNQPVSA